MAAVNQLIGEEQLRFDPGGGGKTVLRPGTVGDQELRQGGDGVQHAQGVHRFAGGYHVSLVGPEVDHRVVLNHIGNVDQLFQLGIHVFPHLAQQPVVAFGNFLAVTVQQEGIEQHKQNRYRQKKYQRVGKNIPVEGSAFVSHFGSPPFPL